MKPLHLCTWLAEELHLHLLELTHTEYELAGNNLVTESLTNLADTEWQLHTAGLLNAQVIYEDTLSCLRTEIYLACSIAGSTHLGREHQVELANVCPVLRNYHYLLAFHGWCQW